jgi:outer membrane protein assembly factor BamB
VPSTTRRALLSAVAVAAAGSLAGCGGTSPDRDGWTQFGRDAANTAHAPDLDGPTEEPTAAWVRVGGSYYRTSTQPLVADRVYANAAHDGLYALDPADGSVVWHDPESYTALTGALADGVVLPGRFGFRRVDADGGVTVGGRRFRYRDWETDGLDYPESPPTVTDDALVAGVGTTGHSPGGGRVVAVDLTDGSVRWTESVESAVWGAPAVRDGVAYAAQRADAGSSVGGALYALDLDDGGQLWRRDLGDDPRLDPVAAPVADGDRVYLSTGAGPLVAFDSASGDPVWTFDPSRGVRGSPALADGVCYVGDLGGRLTALDAATGERRWTESVGTFHGGPAVVDGDVYAVTGEGTLVSRHADGRERWDVSLDPPVTGTPVAVGGRVYVGTADGLLYALA